MRAQGFFVTMLLVRHRAAVFASGGLAATVVHYAGGGVSRKPWSRALRLSEMLNSSDKRAQGKLRRVGLRSGDKDSDLPLCPLYRYVQRLGLDASSRGECARGLRVAQRRMAARMREAPLAAYPLCLRYVAHNCALPPARSWPFPVL